MSIRVYVATGGSPTHFPAPTFTEVTSRVLADDGVTYTTGVSGQGGGEWAAGSFSVTLSNTDGAYSGPALLRRPMLLRVEVGSFTLDHRLVVTDVVEYRDGVRRLAITGTDVLGLVADLEVGQTYSEQLTAVGASSRWLLTADGADDWGSRPLSETPWDTAPTAFAQDFSGQIPVYGSIADCPALSGGGVRLEPVADTGFRGLYARVPSSTQWTWAAWCKIPTDGVQVGGDSSAIVVSVVLSGGRQIGVGIVPPRSPTATWASAYWANETSGSVSGSAFGGTGDLGWPIGEWVWVAFGVGSGNTQLVITRANGDVVFDETLSISTVTEAAQGVVLGGMLATEDTDNAHPATVQIADAVWFTGDFWTAAADLLAGHVGYPGETVRTRVDRLLTEAGVIPSGGTWDDAYEDTYATAYTGGTLPTGPVLADTPLTRRPLADALNEALDTAGYVIHDLPVTDSSRSSLALLDPDGVDGFGGTFAAVSLSRVLRESDGVTTTTGLLVNTCTVTNAPTGVQATYSNSSSVTTYGRRAEQVTSWSQNSDNDASLASWRAQRAASPTQARGLPDLVIDVDGMIADGDAASVADLAQIGACVTVPGMLVGVGNYEGVVRGLTWQHTPQGAMRLTLRCEPWRPLAYAALDITATATLNNVILGW